MSRLIDADKFKMQIAGMAIINNFPAGKANALCELVDAQPTAYDPARVVEQLEGKILEIKDRLMYTHDEDMAVRLRCKIHGLDSAIDIVKDGGVDG